MAAVLINQQKLHTRKHNIALDEMPQIIDLEFCRDGSRALCYVSALDTQTLVQPIEEGILETRHVLLHLCLVTRRYIFSLID